MKQLDELSREAAIALVRRFRDVALVLEAERIGDFAVRVVEKVTEFDGNRWHSPRVEAYVNACAQVTEILNDLGAMRTVRCARCAGCGRIASHPEGSGAPWTSWENRLVKDAPAVVAGTVKPIPCPSCAGKGTVEKEIGV